jgi:TolB-like protein/DNA-binding winged helix-turn-helix (wHTH) protein/Flp pilus assembly protein TadD
MTRSGWGRVASEPLKAHQRITLAQGVEFDPSSDELHRAGRVLKLERIPAAVLLLLVERQGQVVRREEIVERVWGKNVFLDTDNSINSAIRKIRQALKDDPDSPRFIQTISGKGYRYVGEADPVTTDLKPQPKLVSSAVPHETSTALDSQAGRAGVPAGRGAGDLPAPPVRQNHAATFLDRKHRSRFAGVLLTLIALLFLASVAWVLSRHSAKPTAHSPIRSLAVLPLKNLSADPTQEYLADGMTESIIGRLSGIRELRVISRTSSMRFKDTQLSVPEIARQLGGVDAIVEGSVIRDANRIRVHAQLIRAATDEHFWSETYDRELKDVLSLQSDVAQSIAEKVQVTITGAERQRLASVTPVAPEVYENYLKGRFALEHRKDRAEVENSLAYFQRALEKDPNFAPAYVGLSDAYLDLSSIFIGVRPEDVRPKAMEAVRKALELDPQSIEAHLHMAFLHRVQWQWAEAETEVRRALELNPNNAAAQNEFAHWLAIQGRTDEAVAWVRRSRELDPIEVSASEVSWILFLCHRFPEAVEESRSGVALQPDDPGILWYRGYALIANGQPEEAIPPLEKALVISNRSPGIAGVLIRAYAHAGRRADALRLLAELKRRQRSGYMPAGAFVNAYLGLGDTDQAFIALEQGYKEHSNILQFLKVHPHFDAVRSDPRFQDLLHRVGLD